MRSGSDFLFSVKRTSLHHSNIYQSAILDYQESCQVGLGAINTCGMVQSNPPFWIQDSCSLILKSKMLRWTLKFEMYFPGLKVVLKVSVKPCNVCAV